MFFSSLAFYKLAGSEGESTYFLRPHIMSVCWQPIPGIVLIFYIICIIFILITIPGRKVGCMEDESVAQGGRNKM